MRLALLLLFTASASAQAPDSVATAPRRVRPALILAGVGAGVVAVVAGKHVLRGIGDSNGDGAIVLYPAGVAVGVYAVARTRGLDGALGGTAREALRGTLIGLVGGGALFYTGVLVDPTLSGRNRNGVSEALTVGGIALAALAPPFFASRSFRDAEAAPVVLVGPDGERVAGLGLRIGF